MYWLIFCQSLGLLILLGKIIVMHYRYISLLVFFCLGFNSSAQIVEDDFEGSGTITTWFGDNCGMNNSLINPYQETINTSSTVLEYDDIGGQYANVRFDVSENFDLSTNNIFSLKVYVPSSGLSGSQPNQISLKLQDGTLVEPWSTQSEIIKPILLDQWQEVTFDFENDAYINLDGGSPPPITRTDFNRILLQVNGENNNDFVLAYIDDFFYDGTSSDPVFDNLVWSDEFDSDGVINSTNWHHQTLLPAGGSWYNGEIQHYTNRIENTEMAGGFLSLNAIKEDFTDQGVTKNYTSARLNSKFAFTYGKVEIRAKLPTGVGTWPAIWMLGKNINEDGGYWDNQGFGTTNWPACGEVDIMEHWGDNQNYVQSAMHTPSSFGGTVNLGGQTIPTASDDFHIYTLEWSSEKMVFKVDGVTHYTYNPEVKDADTWPFDAEQYVLLNVAILPNIDSNFMESAMVIDYVRVYQETTLSTSQLDEAIAVRFYPNPVEDVLNITFSDEINETVSLQIIDVNGRIIIQDERHTSNSPIIQDVSQLSKGLYFVRLSFNDGKTRSFKLIKK